MSILSFYLDHLFRRSWDKKLCELFSLQRHSRHYRSCHCQQQDNWTSNYYLNYLVRESFAILTHLTDSRRSRSILQRFATFSRSLSQFCGGQSGWYHQSIGQWLSESTWSLHLFDTLSLINHLLLTFWISDCIFCHFLVFWKITK